jgi:hypothetical protein
VTNTELGRNHQDVLILLLVAELLENGHGLGGLTELIRTKLTFTVVVERTVSGLLDQVEHLLHGFTVSWSNLFPPRNGEPSFSVFRKQLLGKLFVGVADTREQFTEVGWSAR